MDNSVCVLVQIELTGAERCERALKNQVGAARKRLGRSARTSFLIVNTDTAALKGYGAGKKVSASSVTLHWKRKACHMRWQCHCRSDRSQRGVAALRRCKPTLDKVQALLCDSVATREICSHRACAARCRSPNATSCILSRSCPNAGVVECSFAWLDKEAVEELRAASLQFFCFAFLRLLLRGS
jgi:hypothetical protein